MEEDGWRADDLDDVQCAPLADAVRALHARGNPPLPGAWGTRDGNLPFFNEEKVAMKRYGGGVI
jgi:hypothetical protein